jgi:hypothetical protein
LTPVHNADEPKLELIHTSGEDVEGVGPCVHQIEFGEDTDCSTALRVDRAGEFKGFGVGEVDVGPGDSEDNALKELSYA